jgi:hypothetical protein
MFTEVLFTIAKLWKLPRYPTLMNGLRKCIYNRDTCTLMFIAALFTIVKLSKQPRCPTTDEWIKKTWYICTMVLLSHKK